VAFESDDYQTVQGLVAAGVGVALIPRMALAAPREDIAVRSLVDGPVRSVIAATPPSARLVPAAGAMLGILQAAVAEP
jgi:DNA-binding transcriptional LysR family regulator